MSCFYTDAATTESYTLSLHDALPICKGRKSEYAGHDGDADSAHAGDGRLWRPRPFCNRPDAAGAKSASPRSEEHTSELQSQSNLVCRLLLEKKNNIVS